MINSADSRRGRRTRRPSGRTARRPARSGPAAADDAAHRARGHGLLLRSRDGRGPPIAGPVDVRADGLRRVGQEPGAAVGHAGTRPPRPSRSAPTGSAAAPRSRRTRASLRPCRRHRRHRRHRSRRSHEPAPAARRVRPRAAERTPRRTRRGVRGAQGPWWCPSAPGPRGRGYGRWGYWFLWDQSELDGAVRDCAKRRARHNLFGRFAPFREMSECRLGKGGRRIVDLAAEVCRRPVRRRRARAARARAGPPGRPRRAGRP
jgi:hypothetical protein